MKLSAPTQVAWIIAVVLGVLSLIGYFVTIPFISAYGFWLAFAAFAILAVASVLKGV